MDELTHLVLRLSALVEIAVVGESSAMTDGFDDVVGRIAVCAIALWSPSLVSSLGIVEIDLGIANTRGVK